MKKIILANLTFLLFTLGCQSVYYGTMEALGHPKRELLVDRVEEARDVQTQAKEQFESAIDKFSAVLNFDGGDLEEKYQELKSEFDRSNSRAEAVHKRVDDVENVALALFAEWEKELEQYSSGNLRRASSRKLDNTRQRYGQLITAMRRVEEKMAPVLSAFQDQVLFLKHNLNARAIASLQEELFTVETEVASLIKEMEASIAQADEFIAAMTTE